MKRTQRDWLADGPTPVSASGLERGARTALVPMASRSLGVGLRAAESLGIWRDGGTEGFPQPQESCVFGMKSWQAWSGPALRAGGPRCNRGDRVDSLWCRQQLDIPPNSTISQPWWSALTNLPVNESHLNLKTTW